MQKGGFQDESPFGGLNMTAEQITDFLRSQLEMSLNAGGEFVRFLNCHPRSSRAAVLGIWPTFSLHSKC